MRKWFSLELDGRFVEAVAAFELSWATRERALRVRAEAEAAGSSSVSGLYFCNGIGTGHGLQLRPGEIQRGRLAGNHGEVQWFSAAFVVEWNLNG